MPTERRYTGVEAHGTGWRGVYRIAGVRHRTHTYPTKREAFEARSLALVEAHQGLHVDRRRSNLTVQQWFHAWQPTRRVRTVTAVHDECLWRKHITPQLGQRRLDAVTPYVVDGWLRWLADNGRSTAVQEKALSLLRTAYQAAIADRRMAVNPCDSVVKPKRDVPRWDQMTRDDFEAIYQHVGGQRNQTILLLGAFAGLRWSEMVGLRRCDYNPIKRTLTVAQGLVTVPGAAPQINPPKSGKAREIPVHPRLKEALDLMMQGVEPEGRIIVSLRSGNHLAASNFRTNVWDPAVKAAGVRHYRIHDMRHAFASWLLQGGADLAQVRDLLGHASVVTTQRYLHVDPDRMRESLLRALG